MSFRDLKHTEVISSFRFFYGYLKGGLFIAFFLSMLVALLDGVGLAMFLPLLSTVDQANRGNADAGQVDMGPLGFILDGFSFVGLSPTLVTILAFMLLFFTLKGMAKFALEYYRAILNQRFANGIRLGNMHLLSDYEYGEFVKSDSGHIQNIMSSEVGRINNAYRNYFQMLQYVIMTAVYVVLAYLSNPKFALIVVVGGLLSNLAFSRIYAITKEASRRISKEMGAFQGLLIESVGSFKFLKATGLMAKYRQKVDRSIIEVEKHQRRVGVMNAIALSIREPLVMAVVISAILIQILIFEESLSLIILSLLFFYRGLTSLGVMQNSYNLFLASSGAIDNVKAFGRQLSAHQETNTGKNYPGLQHRIEVKGLDFSYGDRQILHGLSFTVNKYETVGVVGESGTGKTTLVNLLCGLLTPPPATIFVDGTDITALNRQQFRDRVGYVTQEAQVFTDTIAHNITFWGAPTVKTKARLGDALRLSHAEEFVRALPDGVNTVIGINGMNLSGGQRQRISIARELYREVDLLILDEATSALDSQSEKLIQENIDSLSGSLTMLVIAHRLSTIRSADKIIFLKENGEYEIGTFESLQVSSAGFKTMVELQSV